jgi:hypothetical protein
MGKVVFRVSDFWIQMHDTEPRFNWQEHLVFQLPDTAKLLKVIGQLDFDSRYQLEIFLFSTAPELASEPAQSPNQWIRNTLSLEGKAGEE